MVARSGHLDILRKADNYSESPYQAQEEITAPISRLYTPSFLNAVTSAPAIEILVQAIQRLSLVRSLEEIQIEVRTAARAMTRSDGATFVLRDGNDCFYADEDAVSPLWKGQRFPMTACISGWSMMKAEVAVIPDIYSDERIPQDAYRPTFVKSLVMVPIRSVDPVGAIGIYWAKERQASEEEISLLQALADSTSVAMENVSVYRDLADEVARKTADLRTANAELKREVLLRKRELDEQHRLAEALESFAARAAHDLRSPLGNIQSAINLLSSDRIAEKDRAQVRASIERQTARAVTLVDNLLTLARASGTAHRETFDLSAMVREIAAEFPMVAITTHGIPRSVLADRISICQAITNLIRNAEIYASVDGRAQVELDVDVEGSDMTISVSDRGPGLSDSMRETAFHPFSRGSNEYPGTGLGLAIVGAAAEAHGGRAWCEDRPGGGATFRMSIVNAA